MKCVLNFSIILMIPDGCEPSGVAHHSEFSEFRMTAGWMDGWNALPVLNLFELHSELSFQFNFPSGLANSNSNWQSESESRLQFWILHNLGSLLTWCKATSLPTTLQPRIQLLQMMIRCCLWLRLARHCKKSPYENVLAQMESLAGCWENTLVSCLMSSQIYSTPRKHWLLCLHFKTTIIFVPKKSVLTSLNDDCCLELTLVVMKCFKRLVMTQIKASIPPTLDCLQSEPVYCAYHNIYLPLSYYPAAQ